MQELPGERPSQTRSGCAGNRARVSGKKFSRRARLTNEQAEGLLVKFRAIMGRRDACVRNSAHETHWGPPLDHRLLGVARCD